LFRPRERAFKQFKCLRPQCVNKTFVLIYFLPTFRRTSSMFISIMCSHIKIVNMVLLPTVQCCEEISRLRLSFRLQFGNATDFISKIEMHSGQCGYFTVRNPTFRFIGIFQSLCLWEQLGNRNLWSLFEKCVQAYEIKLKAITNKVIQLENGYEGQQE